MKEYELIVTYQNARFLEGVFEVVATALSNRSTNSLDLNFCRTQINEVLDYIEVQKRFDLLYKESNETLEVTETTFKLAGHKFQTLDHVEKALKNKAFL